MCSSDLSISSYLCSQRPLYIFLVYAINGLSICSLSSYAVMSSLYLPYLWELSVLDQLQQQCLLSLSLKSARYDVSESLRTSSCSGDALKFTQLSFPQLDWASGLTYRNVSGSPLAAVAIYVLILLDPTSRCSNVSLNSTQLRRSNQSPLAAVAPDTFL